MRLSVLFLTMAVLLGAAPQENKQATREESKQEDEKKEPFDPFADPREEMIRRAERAEKERRFDELKNAAAELKDLARQMSDDIEAGGKDVISAKVWSNLDRAEKLLKTMRERAK
jgi:hypothetical protein